MIHLVTFFIGVATLSLVFCLAWWCARRANHYSSVDAVWTLAIGATASGWLVYGSGDILKRMVAALLILSWSLRLGLHLSVRIHRAYPKEDTRYEKLRALWNKNQGKAFFWFFQAQALSVVVFSLPFFLISLDRSSFGGWEVCATFVTGLGLIGEWVADRQMTHFKKYNAGAERICRDGLWNYSRHPNYFFEWITWLGFYLFACGSAWGWTMFYAPALMLFLLLRVTGIPPNEASAILRKGDAYRKYQQTTSSFLPLPPKISTKP